MIFGDRILKYREDILLQLEKLISIKSVQGEALPGKPFGEGPAEALSYMLGLAASLGFETKNIDNYAGHAEVGSGEEIVGVLVHLDVVPEGSGWISPPYTADIREGRMYGRGSADNKGPAVVALYALKALKDANIPFKRRVRVIFGTNEESGMADMTRYFAVEPLPDYGFSPDAGYPIFNREKGIARVEFTGALNVESPVLSMKGGTAANIVPDRCEAVIDCAKLSDEAVELIIKSAAEYSGCRIEAVKGENLLLISYGKPAHASSPSAGLNAISHMAAFLSSQGLVTGGMLSFLNEKIVFETNGALAGIATSDTVSGELTLNNAMIMTSDGQAKLTFDIRYPVTADGEEIIGVLKGTASAYGLAATSVSISPPLYVKEGSPLLKMLSSAYETATGKKAELLSMGGGTYARTLKNRGVAFGSAEGANVHQADEYVTLEGLMYHGRICAQAMYELAVSKTK